MRGFCTTPGVLGRQSAASILFLFIPGAMLISAGCSGLVNGSTSGGGGTPLTISNVAATNATPTSVKIGWQTSTPANSQVEYGTTTSYGSTTVIDPTMVTIHQLTVSNLKPGTAYHCRAHSTDAKNNSAVSGDLACSTPADTMPPTISITSPAANATLSGTVSLTATATDDVAVASVQFKVDNGNTGAAITAAPYSYALNTTTFSNGNHTLTAVATDTSGNTATSTGVPVNVNNATPAPSITSLNPAAGVVGASVTINGANFGATRGTSTVTFNGIATTPTNWTATSIVAPVPNGATTGNVVVTISAPANNSTVSATITLTATATDPDSAVSFVQFQVDGANTGAQLTTAPYSISLDTTTLSNATHTLTAVAQDPSGNKSTSSAVMITVSNTTNPPMGPLKKSTMNTRYFVDPAGNAVFLSGSHTWNDVQDTSQSSSPAAFPFANYVSMLKADGQNATILWRKDMPRECGWNSST